MVNVYYHKYVPKTSIKKALETIFSYLIFSIPPHLSLSTKCKELKEIYFNKNVLIRMCKRLMVNLFYKKKDQIRNSNLI